MFAVIFEVHPEASQWSTYLDIAKSLRSELEQVPGFISNTRYRSLRHDGWVLSFSDWQDEKALIRWRTRAKHHLAQERGRAGVLDDYRLRVGEILEFDQIMPQRQDVTEVGEGKIMIFCEASKSVDWVKETVPEDMARAMGLDTEAAGLLEWDVFDAILEPGSLVFACSLQDEESANVFAAEARKREGVKVKSVRVIRQYGKFDRREAPQYYSDAKGRESLHRDDD